MARSEHYERVDRLKVDIPALADLFAQASRFQEVSSRWNTYDELKHQGIPWSRRPPTSRAGLPVLQTASG